MPPTYGYAQRKELDTMDYCYSCHGAGRIQLGDTERFTPCAACNGTGQAAEKKRGGALFVVRADAEPGTPAEEYDYLFIFTPSHGYLRVPLMECKGLDISECSYMDKLYAYLEEDRDASIFFNHKGWDTWEAAPMMEQRSDTFDDRRAHLDGGLQHFEQF